MWFDDMLVVFAQTRKLNNFVIGFKDDEDNIFTLAEKGCCGYPSKPICSKRCTVKTDFLYK